MNDPDRNHSVVEHHGRDTDNPYVGSDTTIQSGLSDSQAATLAAQLLKAGRKVSVHHGENVIDPAPSLGRT